MVFRKLKASEIDARVATVSEKGCSILLYKDARVDMNLLDETIGMNNWKRSHQLIGDRLYCTVEVWDDEKKQWISKQDVGVESYTEKEKGQASDSFKRACFNLGIGRELYTSPFIWIPASKVELIQRDGRYTTYDRFTVKSIAYDGDGYINELTIVNQKTGETVFQMGKKTEKPILHINKTQLNAVKKAIKNRELKEEKILGYFKIEKLEDMTIDDLNKFNSMIQEGK